MTPSTRIPALSFQHPAFSVIDSRVRERLLALDHFPAPAELRDLSQGLATAIPHWFDFSVETSRGWSRREVSIGALSLIPTRVGSFHDLLGALIWLHFPALKTSIHRLQLACDAAVRGPREDAATHLDESGVLVLSTEPTIFQALSALEWGELFWERRAQLARTTRFLVFGHGLLDSLRDPHPRLMGKALFVQISAAQFELGDSDFRVLVDGALAALLPEFLSDPARLQPLPVLGVPGWSTNQSRAYYDDERYFRRARWRPRASCAPSWLVLG